MLSLIIPSKIKKVFADCEVSLCRQKEQDGDSERDHL